MDSLPRKRKPVTYGKPSRTYNAGFSQDLHDIEEVTPSAPRQRPFASSSRLRTPTKSLTPVRSSVEKSDSGIGDFDIPSSDEDRGLKSKPVAAPGKLSKVNKGLSSDAAATRSRRPKEPNNPTITQPNKRRRVEEASLALQSATTASAKPRSGTASRIATQRAATPTCSDWERDDPRSEKLVKHTEKQEASTPEDRRQAARGSGPTTTQKHTKTTRARAATTKNSSELVEHSKATRAPSQLSTPPRDTSTTKDLKASKSNKPPSTPHRQVVSTVASSNHADQPSTPVASPDTAILRPDRRPVTTPKQSKLWSKVLLDEADVSETPSRSFEKLSLAPRSELMDIDLTETPRKRRLIDSLKAAASDHLSSDDLDVPDVDMLEVVEEEVEVDEADRHTFVEAPAAASQLVPAPQIPIVLHKNTYGQQRSYLQDREQSFEALMSQPIEDLDDITMTNSQPLSSTKADQFDMSDDEGGTAGIRSIFELRAAARSKTFNSDLESLIDDLKDTSDSGRSRRQRALVELFKKLQDQHTLARFVQSGSEYTVFESLRGTEDAIMIATSAAILLAVLEGDSQSLNTTRLYKTGVADLLVRILDNKRDLIAVARDRTNNMTKLAQASVAEMHSIMLNLPIWSLIHVRSISPQLLALKGLERLIRRFRESGNVSEPFLDSVMLSKLMVLINDEALPNIEKNRAVDLNLHKLETALSMIESCTISQNCISSADVWTTSSLSKLADSLVGSLCLQDVDDHQIHNLALRITVNLADGNEKYANCFAQSTLVERILYMITRLFTAVDNGRNDTSQLDALILALAALTNLVECSDLARRNVLSGDLQHLDSLLKDFVANRKKAASATSLEASSINVAYGYLAVMIGRLCQNERAKQRIILRLPTKNLSLVIEAVEEFVAYHEAADRVLGNEAYASFTARLTSVVDALRALDA